MAESYKLTYFDFWGRGEAARMMLTMAGQKFEDDRVAFKDWPALKPTTPLGFVPVLETSKGKMTQTTAINTYIASKTGFIPEDAFDRGQITSILVTINDLGTHMVSNIYMSEVYKFKPTPDDIEQKKKTAREEIAKVLTFIQSVETKGKAFIMGDKVTAADISLFCAIDGVSTVLPGLEDQHSWLQKFMSNMKADAKVADYLTKRKPSPFGV